jgi:thioredoxin 1
MIQVQNLQQLQDSINTGEPTLVYFSGENCSVCKVLKPKIEEEVSKSFPKFKLFEVKTDLDKEITSHFTIFSIPTTLVFFDTKEFKRVGRNMSVSLFIEELKRPYN